MKKEYHHFAFGLFIEEVLKCEKVGISAMCQAIGMSKGTYEMLKKGMISVLTITSVYLIITMIRSQKRSF